MSYPWCWPYWFCDFQFEGKGKRIILRNEKKDKTSRPSTQVGHKQAKVYTGHGR